MLNLRELEPLQLVTYPERPTEVWEVQWVCLDPSLKIKNLKTGEERSGGINGLTFRDLVKLVPDGVKTK